MVIAKQLRPWAFGSVLLGVLAACTGSKEGNPNLELVVPLRGTATQPNLAFSLFCNGQRQAFVSPGILVASIEALGTGTTTGTCALTATPTQPYDALNTAAGDAVFVSLPASGTVQRFTAALTPAPGFAPPAIPNFCPTRLSLSPDESKLVALDDPADLSSGCDNSTTRAARVAVFDARTGALLTGGLLTVINAGDRQSSGQFAASLSDADLIVLEPFANRYRLERYALSNLAAPPAQSAVLADVSASSNNQVDVGRNGTGFVATINGFGGKTVAINLTGTTDAPAVGFGNEVTGVPQIDQPQVVGAAQRAINTRQSSDSLTAYLRPNSVLLKRDLQASDPKRIDSVILGFSSPDLVFTPDGFAWALAGSTTLGSSLQKIDIFGFPTGVQTQTNFFLGGATALSVAWVVQTPASP